ncbi:lytic transglycosylase domain-containing protein [Coraliomargarita parva]|uniref:lytic transglycosylase domain-containing protein n=1 Tax=Coraliomargarita parva TaxID=3014050 RepID=UPI0022B59711|nr:lytic transglycosylase domain-containing protein [Coraliomargarita parva]
MIRIAVALSSAIALLAILLGHHIRPRTEPVEPETVWAYIAETAPQSGIDAEFVYALAWAESSLNAKARSSVARGIMQVTRGAWEQVSDESYREAWEWKTNIRVAVDYLAFCKDYLQENGHFSYPLLAASYRYGPYYVSDKGFDVNRMRKPSNSIYRQIFQGNSRPVSPPYPD